MLLTSEVGSRRRMAVRSRGSNPFAALLSPSQVHSGAYFLSTRFSPQLDPSAVLGVSPTATLQEIRDAYRAKAKKYHPDAGGDEWAFQIINKSYELLSVARVVIASNREEARPRPSPAAPQ